MYLDVEVFVNSDGLAEDVYVLHDIGKLPHVPQSSKQATILRKRRRLHLCRSTLSRHHLGEAPGWSSEHRWYSVGVVYRIPPGMVDEIDLCELCNDAKFRLSRWKQSTKSNGVEMSL